MTTLVAYRMALVAGDLFSEKDSTAASDVAAGVKHWLHLLEPLDASTLQFFQARQERLGRRADALRIAPPYLLEPAGIGLAN
jgi:hypothetical protein